MAKADRCVVRNAAYKKSEFSIRERHNERMNESYHNGDIDLSRSHLNVYFKQPEGNYSEMFEKMLADGTISTKGQKKDGSAKVFDELVFDVNTEYFDRNGGYDYAKSFFEEAYGMAVHEVGGEEYVLSAVMHADERNKALSEELGRDVYHYHLHVTYVPVVDKEVYFSKDNKDPEKAGKLREIIKQVSHCKKWPRFKDDNGWVNSYSLLQDRYHDHMKQAGFTGFERGERGSTAEHLETLDYKIQQDRKRAAELDTAIKGKEQAASKLDTQADKKKKHLTELTQKTAVAEKVVAEIEEIEKMGNKRTMFGGVTLSADFWTKVLNLAKEALNSRSIISVLRKKVNDSDKKVTELERKLKAKEAKKPGITDTMRYYEARLRAPHRLAETIADIMQKPPEQKKHGQITSERGRFSER